MLRGIVEWSVEWSGVWSGVEWSVECGVWSVECKRLGPFVAEGASVE